MLTIVVTALNEEQNIAAAVNTIITATKQAEISDWEIVVCNDGSTDKTSYVANQIAKTNPQVHVKDFVTNHGPGAVFNSALLDATSDQITCLPGDNSLSLESITQLFVASKNHRFVTSHIANQHSRPLFRQVLSKAYTGIWKLSFGLPVNYINGSCIYPVVESKQAGIKSKRFAFSAELTTKLLVAGVPNHEISLKIQSASGKSSVFKWSTINDIIYAYTACWIDLGIMPFFKGITRRQLRRSVTK